MSFMEKNSKFSAKFRNFAENVHSLDSGIGLTLNEIKTKVLKSVK